MSPSLALYYIFDWAFVAVFSFIVVYCYLFSFPTLGNLIELMESVKEKIANPERNITMVSAIGGLQINRTIQNVKSNF